MIFLSNCRIFLTNEKAIKNRFQCALWSRDCYPTSHYLIYYMALSRCLLCTLPLFSKLYIPSTIKTQLNCILFLFLGRLGRQGSTEHFCNFAEINTQLNVYARSYQQHLQYLGYAITLAIICRLTMTQKLGFISENPLVISLDHYTYLIAYFKT